MIKRYVHWDRSILYIHSIEFSISLSTITTQPTLFSPKQSGTKWDILTSKQCFFFSVPCHLLCTKRFFFSRKNLARMCPSANWWDLWLKGWTPQPQLLHVQDFVSISHIHDSRKLVAVWVDQEMHSILPFYMYYCLRSWQHSDQPQLLHPWLSDLVWVGTTLCRGPKYNRYSFSQCCRTCLPNSCTHLQHLCRLNVVLSTVPGIRHNPCVLYFA